MSSRIDLSAPGRAFFLGIGGIGMSALARYLKAEGWHVAGYDRTATPLTNALVNEGIAVSHDPTPGAFPSGWNAAEVLCVYTPAVPMDLALRMHLEASGILHKRSALLGAITRNHPTLAVAGTHGKTTTTTLLAHLLADRCNAFLGGLAAATGSNLHLTPEAAWTVVEADEFDRSFLHLHPTHAAVTSLDLDHLDIYGDAEQFIAGFQSFTGQIQRTLLLHHALTGRLHPPVPVTTYGIDAGALRATRVERHGAQTRFTLVRPDGPEVPNLVLPMPGLHNLENAVAACGLALQAGLEPTELRARLASFQGVHRRFQYHLRGPETVYIDDYAHHPEELRCALEAARSAHPGKPLTGIFQPHLFSRTRDHLDGFAQVLSTLDALVLMPIYPAREAPIPGVDSQSLFDKISGPVKELAPAERIFDCLKGMPRDVVLTLGAGDIDRLVNPLTQWLLNASGKPSTDTNA